MQNFPVLASLDITKTVLFYEEKLGFRKTWKGKSHTTILQESKTINEMDEKEPQYSTLNPLS